MIDYKLIHNVEHMIEDITSNRACASFLHEVLYDAEVFLAIVDTEDSILSMKIFIERFGEFSRRHDRLQLLQLDDVTLVAAPGSMEQVVNNFCWAAEAAIFHHNSVSKQRLAKYLVDPNPIIKQIATSIARSLELGLRPDRNAGL